MGSAEGAKWNIATEKDADCAAFSITPRLQRERVKLIPPGPMAQAFTSRAFGAGSTAPYFK